MTILRHLLSILLLPFMVVVVVPRWLLGARAHLPSPWAGTTLGTVAHALGVVALVLGFALFAWCVALFARVGQGTLAPWDPTRRLVVVGPYRHVRNPMISGVATMLLGEALIHGSRVLAIWLATFLTINQIYFVLLEEPGLVARFGDEYRAYRAAVPRWVPRMQPWIGTRPPDEHG
jgi:protein-S-isoprenylcysteine O-methyltransferase Ste14